MPTPTRFGDLSDEVAQLVSDLTKADYRTFTKS